MSARCDADDGRGPVEPAGSCFQRIHAHVPLSFIMKRPELFIERRINPEIYFSHSSLKGCSRKALRELAGRLSGGGLSVSVHAPFLDLSPGAIDPAFRSLTIQRLRSALEAAAPFRPVAVVFHPGYDPLRFAEHRGAWLRNSIRTWHEIVKLRDLLPETDFLIENIFENEPSTLVDLLESLPSPPFGFCFDTGHFKVFSTVPLANWVEALSPWLREVHIHDNDGSGDSHAPPGEGTFPFEELLSLLRTRGFRVLGTVEAHSEQDLDRSLEWLRDRGAPLC